MGLTEAWLGRGLRTRALLPMSLAYGALSGLRRRLYRAGALATERLTVPVVVVGNVVAGGAGKTPVVAAVVAHLQARGLKPGIVSRGYGRRSQGCVEVGPGTTADQCGDEPLLLARACGVPVAVAARRAEAGRALLARHPRLDVLVCDDGLQHLALARDLEICVFDERGVGNGWLLPAGPLREPWPRPVDLVLRPADTPGIEGWDIARRLATQAVRADGTRRPLTQFAGEPVTALAGIARPQAFFGMLAAQGISPARTIALPDHHDFQASPPTLAGTEVLLCTQKDAVKLWALRPDAWAVPLEVDIATGFWAAFDRLLDARLSSDHGFQTA